MKKILGLAVLAAAFIACNSSETKTGDATADSAGTPANVVVDSTPAAPPPVQYTEGDIIKKDDGKVYVYTNGNWVVADKEIKLDNGTVIKPNGEVKNKEGKTIVLEDGEYVNRSGNFFDKTGAAVSNAWDKTKEGVSDAATATKKGVEKAADKTGEAIEKGVDATKDAAHKTGEAIKTGAKKVGEKTKDVINDIKK
ncbi:DUF6799 domain-containing protein [Niabella soli]|uniref:Membrane protein n=1 Tax=Niabella soli DSM 19437 TaxID=929713 RepID=W0EUE0_9BACT|nr:DUF6799 domain-containing protein [Niabella soli]AHF14402.1 membrane protein [Niabella soli DSM 19437]